MTSDERGPGLLRRAWPYVSIGLLAAVTTQPLARGLMMCSDDASFHLFRAVELGSLIGLGHPFPRWSPHMAQGYGYPFFNFYAPLSSYFVVGLRALGLAYPAALRAGFALGIVLAGLGAFHLVRRLAASAGAAGAGPGAPERAGVAAAAAYMLAPYLGYDVLYRGNFAESFAFVWVPWVLWAVWRFLERQPAAGSPNRDGTPGHVARSQAVFLLLAALFFAALILTHNIFALIAAPLIGGFALVAAWAQGAGWRRLAGALLALGLGAGLAAYFWLPAIAERAWVHSDRLFVPPIFTWYTNFNTLAHLLAPPQAVDPRLMNPSPARALGLVPALLCLPAVAAALHGAWRRARRRSAGVDGTAPARLCPIVLFVAVALLGYAWLTLPSSAPVYRLVSPLGLVQFPWRMLGPAALCAAVLIGLGVPVLERAWLRAAVAGGRRAGAAWSTAAVAAPVAGVAAALLVGNGAWWQARYCSSAPAAGVADLVAYEADTATIGTTAKGEYLPRTASAIPAARDLAEALRRGEEPARLRLPAGSGRVLSAVTADPLDATYTVVMDQAGPAVYRQFYYPGWQVRVDSQPVALAPTPGEGLISFDLPAGTHTVQVRFGATPLRRGAEGVSVVSGLALAGVMWGLRQGARGHATRKEDRRRRAAGSRQNAGGSGGAEAGEAKAEVRALPEVSGPAATNHPLLITLIILALVLVKLLVPDRVPNPLRASRFDAAANRLEGVGEALGVDVAGGLRLHSQGLSARTLASGEGLDVVVYASLREPASRRLWPHFVLEDAAGLAWQDPESLPPRWHREPPHTPLWPLDEYAQWARRVQTLPGTPPGRYTLFGSVFDLDSLETRSLLDEAGSAVAPRWAVGEVLVQRPAEPAELRPPQVAEHDFGPLRLRGYGLDRTGANVGEALLLALFWQSLAAPGTDLTAELALVDTEGVAARTLDLAPVAGYPTSQWQAGDQWRGQHRLRLPAALPAGDYTLRLRVPGAAEGAQDLGVVSVTAPPRSFAAPAFATPSGAELGQPPIARLAGYTLARADERLSLTLAWQALASPETSYRVFVHLADASGRVWAQSDAEPAGWTRPTTGWVPGEYVLDTHNLALPAGLPTGDYTVWAGLYDPASGARLFTGEAESRVRVAEVRVP